MNEKSLTERAIRFYDRYGEEIDSIRSLLEVRLHQLVLAYELRNGLPREAMQVFSRCKTLKSFLKKLSSKGWPHFYYPTEIATDLVGAKIVCWFLDDCYGILDFIQSSRNIKIRQDSLEDYIKNPKASGYRSIHILTDMEYDRVAIKDAQKQLESGSFVCEIQIRTKIQEAWSEFTHDMHYKVKGNVKHDYNTLVAAMADRLYAEDKSAVALRRLLQTDPMVDKHEGIRSD